MSKNTKNYGLFEYEPEKDGAQTFNIQSALNENWDRIDEALAASDPTKAAAKSEPEAEDGVLLSDSAASGGLKRLSWAAVKAALGKVFVPLGRKINGKALSGDVTLTAADVGAVVADETCNYNFTNKGLNGTNIDNDFKYNYVCALSEAGHGTRPVDGWCMVVNYCSTHFFRQVATTCNPVVNVGTKVSTRIFERYRWQGDTQWNEWVEVITKGNVGVTSVLTSTEKTPSVSNQICWQYG